MKLVALLLCALAASAYPAADKGKKIIDEALAALGGEKFFAVKDRVETGRSYSFYRDQLTGLSRSKVYTRYYDDAPEGELKQRERQSFGKDEDYLILFLPDNAYQITYRGAKPIAADRYRRYVDNTRRNIFYILRHRLKEPGLIIESVGTEVWQNSPVEIVNITDADNNVVKVYFHRTTKLPIRQEHTRRDEKTKERWDEVQIFTKFRDVGDGVQWPFNIIAERNGEKVYELYSEAVAINQGLADDLFVLPGSLKVLPGDRD